MNKIYYDTSFILAKDKDYFWKVNNKKYTCLSIEFSSEHPITVEHDPFEKDRFIMEYEE